MKDKVRLNLTLGRDLDNTLESLAEDAGVSKSDVFKQAIALLKAAHDARKNEGLSLAFTKDGQKVDTRIIGVF